jgi:photosystem I P700 chlorophyll a apoprotein A2
MKNLKLIFLLSFLISFVFPSLCISKTTPLKTEVDEIIIPADAHEKAIAALKQLGPKRGAKKINSHMVKIDSRMNEILGVIRGIEAKSEKIESALKDLSAKETETEFQIELSGDVLFDFDKWDMRPEAEESLKKVAEIINASESPKVKISGHTDSKGADDYNQQLSEKRAESVKNWLIENTEVDPKIIETSGYGESKPVEPNTNPDGSDNPEGRHKNRRVEIVVKKK